MDAQQFAYWLNGFAELNDAPPTAEQWQSIREHLATVFVKVTPPLAQPSPGSMTRIYPTDLLRAECQVASAVNPNAQTYC